MKRLLKAAHRKEHPWDKLSPCGRRSGTDTLLSSIRTRIISISLHQIGRSTESPIDFVVTDTVAGSQSNADTQSVQSTISRFACRIKCQRTPPYTARIYAAGFDSSKNIFLGVRCLMCGQVGDNRRLERLTSYVLDFAQEKAAKWKTSDGQMDGLTTNGVLVMHPRNGFTQDSKPGVWREISVCGNVFTLRETRSAQQRGKMVRQHASHIQT